MTYGRPTILLHTLALAVCLGISVHIRSAFAEQKDGFAAHTRFLHQQTHCLTVSKEDGAIVFQAELAADERFILRHRHSVHHSLVLEYLGAGPSGTISILEGHYADYGAGLPQKAEGGQKIEFTGGKARLITAPTHLRQIELRVGRFAEHTIILQEKEIALAEMIEPGMVAILKISEKVCPREYP